MSEPAEGAAGQVLVACVGNIFLGDDAFGVEVAQRLLQQEQRPGVEVVDFGIRGVELAYTLLDHYAALVLVDALPRGGAPGTLYVIEPELPAEGEGEGAVHGAEQGRIALETHSMDPVKVLAFARALGARPIRTVVVGCEPSAPGSEGYDEMRMELSAPVQAALDEAVTLVHAVVAQLRGERLDGDVSGLRRAAPRRERKHAREDRRPAEHGDGIGVGADGVRGVHGRAPDSGHPAGDQDLDDVAPRA